MLLGTEKYRLYLANNQETLEMLVHAYADALVRYAYSYVGCAAAAEDLMEDAFALYLVKKVEFDSKEQIRCWLYKTVRSRSVDYLRRHRRQVSLEDIGEVLSASDPETDLIKKERNASLYRSLQDLPQQYRIALQLHYLDGFSVEQICSILGKSTKQIYNLLARGKAAMRVNLVKEGISYEDL